MLRKLLGLQRCEYTGKLPSATAKAARTTATGDLLVTAMHPIRVHATQLLS